MPKALKKVAPTENGERDPATGRWLPGNRGGPGAPFLAQVAKFRRTLVESVSEEDVREIAVRLVKLAKEGNLAAIRIALPYIVGVPPKVPTDDGDGDVERGPIVVSFLHYIRSDGTEINWGDPDFPAELDRAHRSHGGVQFEGQDEGLATGPRVFFPGAAEGL